MDIGRVGVVGGGQMGGGIAEVCAKAGVDVIVSEIDDEAVAASQKAIESTLTPIPSNSNAEESVIVPKAGSALLQA